MHPEHPIQDHYFYQAEAFKLNKAYEELDELARTDRWDEALVLYGVWDDLSAGSKLADMQYSITALECQANIALYEAQREGVNI